MSNNIVTGPMRIMRRWLKPRHDELPVLQVEPVMDDDDAEFWGDILYFRGLLDDITVQCARTKASIPSMAASAVVLDVAIELVRTDFQFPMPIIKDSEAAA